MRTGSADPQPLVHCLCIQTTYFISVYKQQGSQSHQGHRGRFWNDPQVVQTYRRFINCSTHIRIEADGGAGRIRRNCIVQCGAVIRQDMLGRAESTHLKISRGDSLNIDRIDIARKGIAAIVIAGKFLTAGQIYGSVASV